MKGAALTATLALIKFPVMSTTLTIRNLDEVVKQKLRVRAAQRGLSVEAEAREILSREVLVTDLVENAPVRAKGNFDHLVGVWMGRMGTDEIMNLTRGG